MPSYYVPVVALEMLSWHRRVLKEHWEGCAGTVEYYRSSGKAVLAHWSTIGALGDCVSIVEYYRFTQNSRVEYEHWGGYA